MDKHGVWSPYHPQPNKNVHCLSTIWVFRQKTDANGNLTKFKARLCVRGFWQREGINYSNVFSPTGQLTSLQILLFMCANHSFPVYQMDVKCAFLNGKPEEKLFISCPKGLAPVSSNTLILNKSLYGLKQSPRCWHTALTTALKHIGLTPSNTDPCLYYLTDQARPLWLYAHVDNLLFGGMWRQIPKTNP